MASNKQRNDAELRNARKGEAETSLFGNLIEAAPIDPMIEVRESFSRVRKRHMMLLLMLNAPDFPLMAEQSLYVNVGSKRTVDSMTLLKNGTIETSDGIKESLDAAEAVYHDPGRKSSRSNGWTRIYVQNPNRSYVPLSELIVDHFQQLGVGLDIVTDKKALASYLIAQKWNGEPYTKMIMNASKNKDVVASKAAKLDS